MNTESNPYQAPATDSLQVNSPQIGEVAGKGRRLGTFLIDYAAFFLFAMVLGVVIAVVFGDSGIEMLEKIPELLFGLVLMTSFYVFFEGLWARTPGKFILGTVVVNEDGSKPGWGDVFKRTLCRFIPFEAFSFLGATGIGWHDTISRTRVVLKQKIR